MKSVEPTWSASVARPRGSTRGARRRCRRGARPGTPRCAPVRNRWCTEQWPFQSRNVASLQSASASPPRLKRGFHTAHVGFAVAHRVAGVAAEVLIGEEEDLVALLECPFEHLAGVGGGADRAAMTTDEGLQGGRTVHVGDRHESFDIDHGAQRLPGLLDLVEVGHVGHGAAGVEVGQDHLLVVGGEDVGRLGHEVHAAEHDEVGLRPLLGEHRQPVGVTPGVGPAHHLVALVVVAENEEAVTEPRTRLADPRMELVRRRCRVPLGERGLESHGEPPVGLGAPVLGRCGQPGRPARGCRPWSRYVATDPGGVLRLYRRNDEYGDLAASTCVGVVRC